MSHKSAPMNIRYFAYQIPVGIQSPVKYQIDATLLGINGSKLIPLTGMCLRDPENPGIYYFWDQEGNHKLTTSIAAVKKWSEELSFVNGLKCTYIYPPKYTPE